MNELETVVLTHDVPSARSYNRGMSVRSVHRRRRRYAPFYR